MTIAVQAHQLIYTRVEPAYSAQRKGGFQTVYQTPMLTAAEVVAIENRVQSFTPLTNGQVRYQYFPLDNGALALTHSCKITSHRAITDAEGRTGAFLAHCLIFSPEEFAKVEDNPFAIISAFAFIQDPVTMVETFGQATGIAPPVAVTVETAFPAVDLQWTGPEVEKLVMLAEAAPGLRKEVQSVQILGEPAEALATLNLLFRLIRRRTRLLCSFDLSTEQATIKPGAYWAIGRPQRQTQMTYHVHAPQHRVTEAIEQPFPTADLYLAWLKQALATQPLATVSTKAPLAQALAATFTDQAPPVATDVDPALYAEFVTLHQAYITQRLQTAFGQVVRPEIATTLTRHALDHWPLADNLVLAARQHLDAQRAAELLLAWVEESKPPLDDKAWVQLQDVAQQAANLPLLYLAATLRKKVDRQIQQATLSRLDRAMFQRLLPWLLAPIAPADLVNPAHLLLLLDDSRLAQMSSEQTVELIVAVVQATGMQHLDRLTGYINRLANKELNRLEKQLKQAADSAAPLQQLIQVRRQELAPEQSFWQRFLPKFR